MAGSQEETAIVATQQEAEEDPRAAALALLDERELQALEYMEERRAVGQGYAPIATETGERMFQLFLRGLGTEDIRRLLPGFQLAQIVEARVNGEWDRRREDYDLHLAVDGRDAIRRAQAELALLAADTLSVAARLRREKLHRFTLTRDDKEIDTEELLSMKSLSKNLELLLVATRQESLPGRVGGALAAPEPPPAAPAADSTAAARKTLTELAQARRNERQSRFEAVRRRKKGAT